MPATKAKPRRAAKNIAGTLVEQYFAELDAGRAAYENADKILAELKDTVDVGETIRLDDGREYELQDQFADKDKVWKPCGVSRFTIAKKRA